MTDKKVVVPYRVIDDETWNVGELCDTEDAVEFLRRILERSGYKLEVLRDGRYRPEVLEGEGDD